MDCEIVAVENGAEDRLAVMMGSGELCDDVSSVVRNLTTFKAIKCLVKYTVHVLGY